MIRRGIAVDATLEQMAGAIVERVRPRRIILFGSRARGDARPDSDYDLFVEVDSDRSYHECRSEVYAAASQRSVGVDVLIRKPGELEARRDDPGYMEWAVWREGVVIYPPGAPPLGDGLLPAWVVREWGEPPPSVREWLERAAEDLLNIENNLAGKRVAWSGVCFHAQQATEKHLKAMLVRRWIRPPRSHDLKELVAELRKAGYAMPDLDAECDLLAPYAVDLRYPDAIPIPDEATGRAALVAARRIIDLALPHLR